MTYGTIKVDTVTFTNAGVDKSVTLSGLVQNPIFSGNVTVTGTLSGVTVTGTTANFTNGNFTNISGGTQTIASGVFAAGSAASPSITFTGDLNTGIYSPGADQVAISTGGSGRLFVDASGRLGIGTSSPNYTLDVAGTINANATVRTSNGTHIGILGSEAFAAGVVGVGSTSNHPLVLGTNSLERLRITSAGLVGVGTSSPASLLSVVKAAEGTSLEALRLVNESPNQRSTSSVYIGMYGSNEAYERARILCGNPTDFDGNNGFLSFWTRGSNTLSERLRITSTGLVGIGTTTPQSLLNISTAATSGDQNVLICGTASSGINGSHALYLGAYGSTQYGCKIKAIYNYAGSAGTALSFEVSNNAGTLIEAARIDSVGRVGIGTSSPSYSLDVSGIIQAGNGFLISQNGGSAVRVGAAGQPDFNNPGSDLYFSVTAGQKFAWGNSANRTDMTLDSSGRLGIGTSSPTENLTIYGNSSRFSVTGLTGSSAILLGNQNSGGANNPSVIEAANGALYFGGGNSWSGGGTFDYTMTLTNDNKVGIGTTNPSTTLSIGASASSSFNGGVCLNRGPSVYNFYEASDGTNTVIFGLDHTLAVAKIGSVNSYPIGFFTGNTERLRITSAGFVGIGTSTPQQTLSVSGGIQRNSLTAGTTASPTEETGYIYKFDGTSNTQAGLYFLNSHVSDNATWLALKTTSATNVTSTALVIDSSQRVGIGTTNPDARLTVQDGTNNILRAKQVAFDNYINEGIGITFGRTSDGVDTMAIGVVDDNKLIASGREGILFATGGAGLYSAVSESARIDSSGRLLVGTSTVRDAANASQSTRSPLYFIEGAGGNAFSLFTGILGRADANGPNFTFAKTRSNSIGANTIVQNGDSLGSISFAGADGTDLNSVGAIITAQVDGTPGVDDMPGRIVLSTTADGASSPTERMRIDSSGRVGIGTTSPGNANTTQVSSNGDGIRVQYANTPTAEVGPRLIFGHNTNNGTQQIFSAIKSLMASGNDADWSSHLGFYTGGSSLTERIRMPAQGGLSVGSSVSPNALTQTSGIRLGSSTIASYDFTNVTTSPVTIANGVGIGGFGFVQAYNTSTGAQYVGIIMWRSGVVAVVSESNALGFGLTFSVSGSTLLLQTASGTVTGSIISLAS